MLVRIKNWERYGLKSWIEAAKRRLHHNVLAIALANKLARIAWAVLAKGCAFELTPPSWIWIDRSWLHSPNRAPLEADDVIRTLAKST